MAVGKSFWRGSGRSFCCSFSRFFVIFRIFCSTSLKLRFVKVDRGVLHVLVFFMTILNAISFGTPNINTQIYTNFYSFKLNIY